MANGLYMLGDVDLTTVESENFVYSNEITDNTMEDGSNIQDHVKGRPVSLKISGIITGDGGYPQEELNLLRSYAYPVGQLIAYKGLQVFSQCIIESFGNEHGKEIKNGMKFDITLKTVSFANKTEVNFNTDVLNIPDIEALKDQLSAQKSANKKAATAKLKKPTSAGTQSRESLSDNNGFSDPE